PSRQARRACCSSSTRTTSSYRLESPPGLRMRQLGPLYANTSPLEKQQESHGFGRLDASGQGAFGGMPDDLETEHLARRRSDFGPFGDAYTHHPSNPCGGHDERHAIAHSARHFGIDEEGLKLLAVSAPQRL